MNILKSKTNNKSKNVSTNKKSTMSNNKMLMSFDEYYEKGWIHSVITTNLNYRIPELLTRPYYIEANMSKYLASIIDTLNHDISVDKVQSSSEKIMSLMNRVGKESGRT